MTLQSALDYCKKNFISNPDVIGVGRGKEHDQDCIVILVKDLNKTTDIPSLVEEIPIVKKEAKPFRAGETS